jgi:transcription initiation factor TFIIB
MSSRGQPRRVDSRDALGELFEFSEVLSVPGDVADEAARLCIIGLERGLGKGKPAPRIAAASLYAACRKKDFPAALDDIAAASHVDKRKIASTYRLFVRRLGLEMPIPDPIEYVPRVASRINADEVVQTRAVRVLLKAEDAGIVAGVNPFCVAASALYVASAQEGVRLTQKGAAAAAGVGLATLQKTFTRMRRGLDRRALSR